MRPPRLSSASFLLAFLGAALTAPLARSSEPAASEGWEPIASPATVMPAYGPWFSSRLGGGGYILDAFIHPLAPDVWYAHSDVAGVYRSDDAGLHWRMIHGSLPPDAGNYCVRSFNVAPDAPDELVIACGSQWFAPEGLYRTTDAGRTWTPVLRATIYGNEEQRWTGPTLARDVRDPARMWAATASGLHASQDRGATWQTNSDASLVGLLPTALVQDPARPDRLWLCARPFTPWGKPALRGGLFRSDDAGRTWQLLAEHAPTEILVHPAAPAFVLGLFDDTEFRFSRDGGVTWTFWHEGLPHDPADTNHMVAHRFQAVTPTPDGFATMNVEGKLFHRALTAAAWTERPRTGLEQGDWYAREEPGKWSHFGRSAATLRIHPHDPARWLMTDWYGIYESRDSGSSWTLRVDGIETVVMHTLRQDPSDPARVHAGMGDIGYVRSNDGAASYGQTRTYLTSVKCIDFADIQPARIYALGTNTGKWYAEKLFVSADHGENFTEAPLFGVPRDAERHFNSLVVDPRDPLRLLLAVTGPVGRKGRGGVYVSTDGGRSFSPDSSGIPDGSTFFESNIWGVGAELAAAPDGTAYALSRPRRELWRRRADEARWTRLPLPACLPYAVSASPHDDALIFVATSDTGLWRSPDAGATWTRVLPGDARSITPDHVRPGRWAAGLGDGVHLSEDAGLTWRLFGPELPGRVRPAVAFAGDRLLAGTLGSGLFWAPLTPEAAAPIAVIPSQPTAAPAPLFPAMKPTKSLAFAALAASALQASPLPNGAMSDGATRPDGWGLWAGSGQIELVRDTTTYFAPPASLRLSSQPRAYGSTYLAMPRDVREGTIGGFFRTEGKPEECTLAVRVMDATNQQIAWLPIAQPNAPGEWREFSESYRLPDNAASATLVATIKGEGRLWLDELTLLSAEADAVTATPGGGADRPLLAPGAAGWLTWTARGKIVLARGPGPKDAPGALTATSPAPETDGSVYLPLPAKGGQRLRLQGATRLEGDLQGCMVALQCFDNEKRQVGWITITEPGTTWSAFSQEIEIPADAASASVILTVKGAGSVALDNLTWSPL